MEKIEFMGYVLSAHLIGVADSNITAIQNARIPQSVSEVRSFLGLVNFVGGVIQNMATIAEPLNRLLRKNQIFKWVQDQQIAFDN